MPLWQKVWATLILDLLPPGLVLYVLAIMLWGVTMQ